MAKPRKNFAKKETGRTETDAGQMADRAIFTWGDKKVTEYPVSKLPEAIVKELTVHGLKQKMGDSYNLATTITEARETAEAVWVRLCEGDFNAKGGGGFGIADEWIVRAVAHLREKDVGDTQAIWDTLSDERKEAIRKDARVKAEAERIRAEVKVSASEEKDQLAEF